MRHFVFCHGLGFNRNFWKNLAPKFSKEKCTYLDLGYFNVPCEVDFESDGSSLIGIAHSLGLPKLLMLNKKFDYLIGLNSFINFLGYEPALRQQREQEINILKKHFVKSPSTTMRGFYQRCGVSVPSAELTKLNTTNILNDIAFLKMNFNISKVTKLLIIGTKNDTIVPPRILYDNFDKLSNVRVKMLDQGKHGLGYLEAQAVSVRIMSFINDAD